MKQYKPTRCFNLKNITISGQQVALIDQSKSQKIILLARSKILIKLSTTNPLKSGGYAERLNAGPGIFIGDVLVFSSNGKCQLYAFNTTVRDVILSIPPVQLQDFYALTSGYLPLKHKVQLEINRRVEILKNLVDLTDFNAKESASIFKILREYLYQFHLPGDKLRFLEDIEHRIRTTTDAPVNVKQYLNPFYLKDEIQEQNNKMDENDIIKPSVSAFNAPLWVVPKRRGSSNTKKWRLVIDYRGLNAVTVDDISPTPHNGNIGSIGRRSLFYNSRYGLRFLLTFDGS